MKKTQFTLIALALLTLSVSSYADRQNFTPSPDNSYTISIVFPTLSGQAGEAFNMVISGSYKKDGYSYPIDTLNVTDYPGRNYLWGITSTGTVTSVTMTLNNIQHRDSATDGYTTTSITSSSCKNMNFVTTPEFGQIDVTYDKVTDTYSCTH